MLELPVIQQGNRISITAGATKIIFETTALIENPFYHFAFNIPSNKFPEALQWMKEKATLLWLDDYKGHVADFTNWHAKSFYFPDPAHNIVEFIARFDLNDTVDELFSAAHIRNVSEIGLVFPVKNFDAGVDNLLKEYPLPTLTNNPHCNISRPLEMMKGY